MANKVYNTIRSVYVLFAFNFMLCALFFWAAHTLIIDEEQRYVFSNILDDRYLSIVSGYLIVYAIMSLIFSSLFVSFKLNIKRQNNKLCRYTIIFFVLALVGLLLYMSAWYYWDLCRGLSGWNLFFKMCWAYFVDLIAVYLRGILLWFFTTIVATYIFVSTGLTPNEGYRK